MSLSSSKVDVEGERASDAHPQAVDLRREEGRPILLLGKGGVCSEGEYSWD